jgi:TatD DNase family protein
MLIDTHCHLNFKIYDQDRLDVISNAKKAGVKKFIVPGVEYYSNIKSIELSTQFPEVIYPAIGFHPYETSNNPDVYILEKLLTKQITAIGECGLDYHIYGDEPAFGKKSTQITLFQDQLKIALKYNLPVIIHCRDAFADIFNVLDSLPQMPQGVIHCFSGGLQDVRMANQRNLFIGIDGNITFSKHLQQIIPEIPLNYLLLETDSPNLTPIPHRGIRNEPKHLIDSAKFISKLLKIDLDSLKKQTSLNAFSLFHFT